MRRRLVLSVLLAGAIVLVYWPALGGGFIWDDDLHVTGNLALRHVEGLRWIWLHPGWLPAVRGYIPTQYYPLLHTSFWIDYQLWGLDPRGYHAVNVLLQVAVSLLVWRVLRRLEIPGALLAAAVFALHPVQVESVAWITERKNLLSALFSLAAALAYFRFSPPEREPASGRSRDYILALLLFLLALLSKTVAVSLPVALGLVLWWKRGRLARRELPYLLAMLLVGLSVALVTVAIEWSVAGAKGHEFGFTPAERLLIAGRALWFYLGKLAWPAGQAFVYPSWEVDASAPWQYVFPLGAILVLLTAWRFRQALGRGPLCAMSFFAVTLSPALGFLDFYTMRYTFVADHFQYLASLGPIALASAAATALLARLPRRRVGVALAVALVAVLGGLSFRRAHAFRSNDALWQDTLAKNPQCWMALNNLAADRMAENRLEEAQALLERAIEIRADHPNARMNLGSLRLRQGRIEEAIEQFEIAAKDARHYSAHYRIGQLRAGQGRHAEAIEHYRAALAKDPGRPLVLNALGAALALTGREDEAAETYRLALAGDEGLLDARYNLAMLLVRRGRTAEARDELAKLRQVASTAGAKALVQTIDADLRRLTASPAPIGR